MRRRKATRKTLMRRCLASYRNIPPTRYMDTGEHIMSAPNGGQGTSDPIKICDNSDLQSLFAVAYGTAARSKYLLLDAAVEGSMTNTSNSACEVDFYLCRCKQSTDQGPDQYWGTSINIVTNSTINATDRGKYLARFQDVGSAFYRVWKPVKRWSYRIKPGETRKLMFNLKFNRTVYYYEIDGSNGSSNDYDPRWSYALLGVLRGTAAFDNTSATSIGTTTVGLATVWRKSLRCKVDIAANRVTSFSYGVDTTGNEQVYVAGLDSYEPDQYYTTTNPT